MTKALDARKLTVLEPPEMTFGAATSDGGFYISKEQLERLAPGQPKRARKDIRMLLADMREPRRIYGPTKKPESVRIATPRDEKAVFDLMVMAHKENGQQFAPLNPRKVEDQIQAATNLKGNVLGLIDGLDGPVAMALLSPCQWWWAESHYFGDLVQYVHPEHRKSQHADDLLTFERWCADDMARGTGYPIYLVAGVLSLYRTREKERLWRRHLNSVGSLYIYPWPLPEHANGG